ncbi:hypothetical protein PQR14_31320 [Paraburkholderia bryophila]|nr:MULTISPECIES: hypothetical protein [Burkholderiaceae]
MSDFEHFAAFFGNLIDPSRRHNEAWGRLAERIAGGVWRGWMQHDS